MATMAARRSSMSICTSPLHVSSVELGAPLWPQVGQTCLRTDWVGEGWAPGPLAIALLLLGRSIGGTYIASRRYITLRR